MNIFNIYKARYLIRLDDASHYSNLSNWGKIEDILDKHNIKPIVAVIPNNKDQSLNYSSYNYSFWKVVKKWKEKNWSIAMHGHSHSFHKVKRKNLIFPFYNRSEFAELSLEAQKIKIKKSLNEFKKNNIYPELWVAPGHSFDKITLKALKNVTNINIVSDGIAFYPYYKEGFHFIPQQLWDLKKRFFGLWTICLHPDTMTASQIVEFEFKIKKLSKLKKFISIDDIKFKKTPKSIFGSLFSLFFWTIYELKTLLKIRDLK